MHPVVLLGQVALARLGDVGVINQPVDELTLLSPGWGKLESILLVESLIWLLEHVRSVIDLENALNLVRGISAGVKISNHISLNLIIIN